MAEFLEAVHAVFVDKASGSRQNDSSIPDANVAPTPPNVAEILDLRLEDSSVSTETNAQESMSLLRVHRDQCAGEHLLMHMGRCLENGGAPDAAGESSKGKCTDVSVVTADYHQFRARRVFERVIRARGGVFEGVAVRVADSSAAVRELEREFRAAQRNAKEARRGDEVHVQDEREDLLHSDHEKEVRIDLDNETIREERNRRTVRRLLSRGRNLGERMQRKWMCIRELFAVVNYWWRGVI